MFVAGGRQLGKVVLNRSSLAKNKSSRCGLLIDCKRWLVCGCWGREGSSSFFLEAGDGIPM